MSVHDFRIALRETFDALAPRDEPLTAFSAAFELRGKYGPMDQAREMPEGLVSAWERVLALFGRASKDSTPLLTAWLDDNLRERLALAIEQIPAVTLRSTLRRLERRGVPVASPDDVADLLPSALLEYARNAEFGLAPGP